LQPECLGGSYELTAGVQQLYPLRSPRQPDISTVCTSAWPVEAYGRLTVLRGEEQGVEVPGACPRYLPNVYHGLRRLYHADDSEGFRSISLFFGRAELFDPGDEPGEVVRVVCFR
jgi:hypothetical protein